MKIVYPSLKLYPNECFTSLQLENVKTKSKLFQLFAICFLYYLSIPVFAQQPCETNGYPYNTSDITWTDTGGPQGSACLPITDGDATFGRGTGSNPIITDIAAAFNFARTAENGQSLGAEQVIMPTITIADLGGSDAVWNMKSPSQKTFILMNLERTARGIPPFQEVDANVQSAAQNFAEYLRLNDEFSHNVGCGGAEPCNALVRMDQFPAINDHREFTCRFENLAVFYASNESCSPLTLERAVYTWIYEDLISSNGHRNACLFNGFNDNYGASGAEGQFGIGLSAGPYNGSPHGVVIAFNFFDPDPSYNPAMPIGITTFLEGPYNSTNENMDDNLTATIPLTSPFTIDPQTVTAIPTNVADWVLAELRDKDNSSVIVASKSAFILKNGSVVDLDGLSPLKFPVIGDNYFISVKHRNHLSIMSKDPVSFSLP